MRHHETSWCCFVTSHRKHTIAGDDGTPETEYPKPDKHQATLGTLKANSRVDISLEQDISQSKRRSFRLSLEHKET